MKRRTVPNVNMEASGDIWNRLAISIAGKLRITAIQPIVENGPSGPACPIVLSMIQTEAATRMPLSRKE
jgi:hypothetical protein